MREKSDFAAAVRIARASVQANFVPMLLLQFAAVGIVLAYCLVPSVRAAVEPVADWHRQWGWRAAFLSQAFFCGLLPGIILLCFRSIRPCHPFKTILAQSLWCGAFGIANNALFRLMADAWGDQTAILPIVAKASFDQFVWTVLVIAPANAVFFFWLGRDFSLTRVRAEWPRPFFRRMVLPNLIPNWVVWIPVSLAIFSFPYALQIHVNGLACTFWTLMCLQIGSRT